MFPLLLYELVVSDTIILVRYQKTYSTLGSNPVTGYTATKHLYPSSWDEVIYLYTFTSCVVGVNYVFSCLNTEDGLTGREFGHREQ